MIFLLVHEYCTPYTLLSGFNCESFNWFKHILAKKTVILHCIRVIKNLSGHCHWVGTRTRSSWRWKVINCFQLKFENRFAVNTYLKQCSWKRKGRIVACRNIYFNRVYRIILEKRRDLFKAPLLKTTLKIFNLNIPNDWLVQSSVSIKKTKKKKLMNYYFYSIIDLLSYFRTQ